MIPYIANGNAKPGGYYGRERTICIPRVCGMFRKTVWDQKGFSPRETTRSTKNYCSSEDQSLPHSHGMVTGFCPHGKTQSLLYRLKRSLCLSLAPQKTNFNRIVLPWISAASPFLRKSLFMKEKANT